MLKVSHAGNKKLGKKVSVFSRAVGDTCPSTCYFLGNGCYAQRTERLYKNARLAGEYNSKQYDWRDFAKFLAEAAAKGNDIRWLERGDFLKTLKNGAKVIDRGFISAIIKANKHLQIIGVRPPLQWVYTHVYSSEIVSLESVGVSVYASINSEDDYIRAKAAGFRLFAFGSEMKKGKSQDKAVEKYGNVVPVCWEQLGTKETCSTCKYCIKGIGDIVFLKH